VIGILSFLTAVAGPSDAGTLKGRVQLSGGGHPQAQESGINPYPGTLGSLSTERQVTPTTSPRDVVLYIPGKFGNSPSSPTESAWLAQRGQQFEPLVIGISVGNTVGFPNEDAVFHNVFSYSKTNKFDLGYYGKGKSKSVRFNKPGLVQVFCDIHSNMQAYIYVVDTPYVAQPDADGMYSIGGIPPGEYTLKTWHPTRGTQSRTVEIGNGETNLDLNL